MVTAHRIISFGTTEQRRNSEGHNEEMLVTYERVRLLEMGLFSNQRLSFEPLSFDFDGLSDRVILEDKYEVTKVAPP